MTQNCSKISHKHQDKWKCIEEIFIESKLELTELRKSIISILIKSNTPLKAYDIVDKLKTDEKSIKPISVYRILDLLLKKNIIHKIHSLNSFLICSHPGETHHCSFMICEECNKVSEICKEKLQSKLTMIAESYQFQISNAVVELLGKCLLCKNLMQTAIPS